MSYSTSIEPRYNLSNLFTSLNRKVIVCVTGSKANFIVTVFFET